MIKPERELSGYVPDVAVLDAEQLDQEPRWEKASTIIHGRSVKLVIEVVSINWRVDYGLKLDDYEEMGIPEYWIIDDKALGAFATLVHPNSRR